MGENKLTVGQIAQKFGISARAVRHYENIGLLESDRDANSNYRLYGDAESNRVDQILLLKSMGFTLKETSTLITSSGNRNLIMQIVDNKMKALAKKSLVFSQCIELLNEFLNACRGQDEDNIDSFKLLNEILTSKKENEMPEMPERPDEAGEPDGFMQDRDLDILNDCLSEDFNSLFLPFVVGREDGDILENYFVNHRRFWGFRNVCLTDGSNLEDIYNPATFGAAIKKRIGEIAWNPASDRSDGHSYKQMVAGLCSIMAGMDFDMEDPLPVLEMKLVGCVFARALEMLEFAGRLNEESIRLIAEAIGIESNCTTKREITDALDGIIQSGGIQAFYLARVVNNAVKRNRYAGPFYVLTEPSAFGSSHWELDRALDLAAGFLWTHEISPAGRPFHTLMPVIFHIAYMRARMLYASTSHTQPELVYLDGFMIIGLELVTTDRNGESFARVPRFEEEEYISKRMNEHIPNRVRPGARYGLNCRRNGEYYSYIVGEQVSSLETIPDGMTGEPVPAGAYAVFRVCGGPLPHRVIETIIYAYQYWLPDSGYQWVNRPGFNLFCNASGLADTDISIYIPVEKKEVGQ